MLIMLVGLCAQTWAQDCATEGAAALSFAESYTTCMTCAQKTGNPGVCQSVPEIWCLKAGSRFGGDYCKVPECGASIPKCQNSGAPAGGNCASQASVATTYGEFINRCNQCEGNQAAAHICDFNAKNWCQSHCEGAGADPTCKSFNLCPQQPSASISGFGITDEEAVVCSTPGWVKINGVCGPDPAKSSQAKAQCQAAASISARACTPPQGVYLSEKDASIAEMCKKMEEASLASANDYLKFGQNCRNAAVSCKEKCGDAAKTSPSDGQLTRSFNDCERDMERISQAANFSLGSKSAQERSNECNKLARAKSNGGPKPQSDGSGLSPTPSPGATPSPTPSSNNPYNNQQAQQPQGQGGGGAPSMPSMGGGGSPSSSSPQSYANNGYSGYQNPQTQQPLDQVKAQEAQSGFRGANDPTTAKDFNVGDTKGGDAGFQGVSADGAGGGGRANNAAQVRAIANNSGGSIPGSENSGARFQPQGRSGGVPTSQQSTDVLQGFQNGGGGGSGYGAGGGSGFTNESGRFKGYGGGNNRAPANARMDLRNYLPGGRFDPGMRAGGFRPTAFADINAQHVNIWSKVGDRLREKCRLGELYDCR